MKIKNILYEIQYWILYRINDNVIEDYCIDNHILEDYYDEEPEDYRSDMD